MHETTEDEAFTGRVDALARFDSWAADPGVGLIAVTAIGGLGKTALVARWLRSNGQVTTPAPDGQFFWSFYRDRSAQHFLEALVDFGQKDLGWTPAEADAASVDLALDLLRAHRVQVTLDGLEVIQEAPGTVAYGTLLDVELADFLHRHCRSEGASLVLLTSRFPFPDLMPHLGGSLRSLALPPLSSSEGAALLDTLGVLGEPADREAVSDKLAGHPMALRIFAQSMPPDVG